MATDLRKAKVTDEHREEARRLRELWDTRLHETQAIFGERYAIGGQSAVGQFLRGEVPLSLGAARGFAEGLGCQIADFSPRLAKQATSLGMIAGDSDADLTRLNKIELQLIQLFRGVGAEQKDLLMQQANHLYNKSNPGSSAANPFPNAPKAPPH